MKYVMKPNSQFRFIEGILKRPFTDEEINWRVATIAKGGKKCSLLAYMDSRGVRDRLDEAFGYNWEAHYSAGPQGGVMCTLRVLVGDNWVQRSGIAENTKIEAVKGGESDALKRAATAFGIGRSLYDLPDTWVYIQDDYPKGQPRYRCVRVFSKRENVSGWVLAPAMETLVKTGGTPEPTPKKPIPETTGERWSQAERKLFFAQAREAGWLNYEDIKVLCQLHKMPAPSFMNKNKRDKFVKRLAEMSTEDREEITEMIHMHRAKGEMIEEYNHVD